VNAHVRTFEDRPAIRSHVPLLVGLMGPSGSGKTFSALRLASGIQRVSGGEIFFIDTESKRALHYADQFKFRHIEFSAPFGSLDYLSALQYCVNKGAGVIIVDSMSHEHSGPGGYLLTQEAEIDRMAGDDYAKRERVKMAGWIKPAKLRQQFITGMLQLNSNFVFCFRAKEKTKPVKGEKQPVEMGFMPIAGEEFLFEMTLNCLLLPKANGVPTWRSDQLGEKMMMKLPGQFEPLFEGNKPLDEEVGRSLAEWARGGGAAPTTVFTGAAASNARTSLVELGAREAALGMNALRAYWTALSKADKALVGGAAQLAAWKTIAEAADAPDVDFDEPNNTPSSSPVVEAAAAGQAPVETGAPEPTNGPEGEGAPDPQDAGPSAPAEMAVDAAEVRRARTAEIKADGQARAESGKAALSAYLEDLRQTGEIDLVSQTQRAAWNDAAKAADKAAGRK
jgi:ABC-type oligopeptide transport system ATPase subunit